MRLSRVIVSHLIAVGVTALGTYYMVSIQHGPKVRAGLSAPKAVDETGKPPRQGLVLRMEETPVSLAVAKELQEVRPLSRIERHRRMFALVDQVDLASLPAVWRALDALPNDATDIVKEELIRRFGAIDPDLCRVVVGDADWARARLREQLLAAGDDAKAFGKLLAGFDPDLIDYSALSDHVHAHPDAAWGELARLAPDADASFLLGECVAAIAATDPQRALDRVCTLDPAARRALLPTALVALYDKDPLAAQTWIAANPAAGDGLLGEVISESRVFKDLLRTDPAAALQRFGNESPDLRQACLSAWIEHDGDGFVSWVRAQHEANPEAMRTLMGECVDDIRYGVPRKDLVKLRPLLDILSAGKTRNALLSEVAKAWGAADTDAAAAWALSLPAVDSRNALDGIAEGVANTSDPHGILAFLGKHAEHARPAGMYYCPAELFDKDMQATIALQQSYRLMDGMEFACALYMRDPEAARRFADASDSLDDKVAYATQFLDKDPVAAVAYVMALPEDRREAALESLGKRAVGAVPDGVAASVSPEAFLNALPDDGLRDSCTRWWLERLAATEPEVALRKQLTGRLAADADLTATIADEWASVDPAASSAWASALPEGEVREKVVGRMIGSLFNNDPVRAVDLGLTLPEETRARRLSMLARRLAAGEAGRVPTDRVKAALDKLAAQGYVPDADGTAEPDGSGPDTPDTPDAEVPAE